MTLDGVSFLSNDEDADAHEAGLPPGEISPSRPFLTQSRKNPLPSHPAHNLPLHLVGLVAVSEAESAGEVAAEEVFLLDAGKEGLVDGLLVVGARTGDLLLLRTQTY